MSVLVTAAPGCHFTIAPHPSGIPGLRPLVIYGGDKARVTPARADELCRAGLIVHPVTGHLPMPYVAEAQRVTIQGDAAPIAVWDGRNSLSPQPPPATQQVLSEVSVSDPSRVAQRTFNVAPGWPRALVDITFEDAMRDPVSVNQQAVDLPWPL